MATQDELKKQVEAKDARMAGQAGDGSAEKARRKADVHEFVLGVRRRRLRQVDLRERREDAILAAEPACDGIVRGVGIVVQIDEPRANLAERREARRRKRGSASAAPGALAHFNGTSS